MIILPHSIRIFSSFLAVSTTDKPVNRSIHAHPLKQLNVFALRGFIFRDIHKKKRKQGRSSSNSGYKIQKICGWKIYSRTRTFGEEVHKSNIRVKKWYNKYENGNFVSMICLQNSFLGSNHG